MTRRACAAILAAAVLALLGAGATASDGDPIDPVGDELAVQLDEAGIPGGAVAVVSGDRIDARGAGGISGDTPFVIGSASKSFAALAIMQLADDGRVDLDASVRDYVPGFELGDGEPADDVTVRHALQHTSGLDDLAGGPLLASAADGTPRAAVAELRNTELASAPGETWRYANANYVLASLIVEDASGIAYDEYLQREIFTPLGMTRSSAVIGPAVDDLLASGHRFWFGVPVATPPTRRTATLAAGYLVSTAEDLGRYLSLYLTGGVGPDGTRIVSAAGVEMLLAPGPEARLGPWADGVGSRYAMGWFVGGPWGERVAFHPGNTPDTTTLLVLAPDHDRAVAAFVDAGHEIPVPGNAAVPDRVTRNVVHAALGQPTMELPSLRRFYLVFDVIVLGLLALAGWALARSVRIARSPAIGHAASQRAGAAAKALAATMLAAAPSLSYGWRGLWTWAPDAALALATVTLMLAAAAVTQAVGLVRSAGRGTVTTAHPEASRPVGASGA